MIRTICLIVGTCLLTGCASVPLMIADRDPVNAPLSTTGMMNSPELVHFNTFTLDTHIDVARGYESGELNSGDDNNTQFDLPGMREGGLDSAFFIVYVGQGTIDPIGYDEAREAAESKYQAIARMLEDYPDQIALARTADEVEAIHDSGRLVALIGIENSYPLGDSVEDVAMWAERGVRYASITHFGNNQFGGSSNPNLAVGDSPEDPGLTELGRELVRALNDHGIMVDVSHVGKQTGLDAIALSRAPVIGSHSGARAEYDHPRNFDDEQLRAIAANGGVAQMVAFKNYLRAPDPDQLAEEQALAVEFGFQSRRAYNEADPEVQEAFQNRRSEIRSRHSNVSVSDLVDHIDHAVSVAGIDHVGIVSDFDGGGGVVGWEDVSETPAVTYELIERGYSEEDIAKLWGGNVLRVMRAVEAAAVQ